MNDLHLEFLREQGIDATIEVTASLKHFKNSIKIKLLSAPYTEVVNYQPFYRIIHEDGLQLNLMYKHPDCSEDMIPIQKTHNLGCIVYDSKFKQIAELEEC